LAAPIANGEQVLDSNLETNEADVSVIDPEIQIFDLYAVSDDTKHTTQPFVHRLDITAEKEGFIKVWANFDDGALANAMSITKFNAIKHLLGNYKPSSRWLRMADGSIVKPTAVWEGRMEIQGVQVYGSFEVFESGSNWEFLLGKPLLTALHAIHEYTFDTITIENNGLVAVLRNQVNGMTDTREEPRPTGTKEPEERKDLTGSRITLPPREVSTDVCYVDKQAIDIAYIDTTKHHSDTANIQGDHDSLQGDSSAAFIEIEVDALKDSCDVFTRATDPWKKERVEEILKQVKVGPDLSSVERGQVYKLLAEWADVFALSVSEVKHVEDAVHHLDIAPGTVFSTKVNQKPLTPPQKKYLYESIDTMLKADVIEQCSPSQVKCASPTTLAQKTHTGSGLMLEELQHRVNDECISHGFEPFFSLPPRTSPTPNDELSKGEPKWRICQNFSQINKVTKVAPMPQGDIRAKQQRLSGHRWVTGFDFAAGFYAVAVDPESRPYTAFYVEGRGYFQYKRMPFGLTGAPSTFAHMTATRMHELIANGTMELFVDDGGTAADTFEEMIEKLTKIFTLVRRHNLSLSASKCEFFMTTMVFAGASVGPAGVQPDLSKLTAIVNWKVPEDALALAGFLGLTGWFRDLILGYARKGTTTP
jgi:hypothetical protein